MSEANRRKPNQFLVILLLVAQVYVSMLKAVVKMGQIIYENVKRSLTMVAEKTIGSTNLFIAQHIIWNMLAFSTEILSALIFCFGPYILMGFTYQVVSIVALFVWFAKRMKWRENIAHGLGLDVAGAIFRVALRIWHGQEFRGFENIPSRGGALIVWYHGPVPIDYFGLMSEVQLRHGRLLHTVMDRCLANLPNSGMFTKYLGCTCEGRAKCIELLSNGYLLGVAPGGSRECLFGENYEPTWGSRVGFAKVAMQADVPIIPVYTQNICEAYQVMRSGQPYFRQLYEYTRLPIIPIWGGFPVKLTTHIGKPIRAAVNDTPESFRQKVMDEIKAMVAANQRRPNSIPQALMDRFPSWDQLIQSQASTSNVKPTANGYKVGEQSPGPGRAPASPGIQQV